MRIEPHRYGALAQSAIIASVCAAVAIFVIKLLVWFQTGSSGVLSATVDSAMDLLTSLINLFAVRYSLKPADDDHRFGHSKAEALAAYSQGVLMLLSGGAAAWYAISGVSAAALPVLDVTGHTVLLMGGVLVITLLLVIYQLWVIRVTDSLIVRADSLHYRSDLLINGAALLGLVIGSQLGWVDSLVGGLIALYIVWSALQILVGAMAELLDKALEPSVESKILGFAQAQALVQGVHDFKTRRSGNRIFVEMHLELDSTLSLDIAHEAGEQVERQILNHYPGAEVIIHLDPV